MGIGISSFSSPYLTGQELCPGCIPDLPPKATAYTVSYAYATSNTNFFAIPGTFDNLVSSTLTPTVTFPVTNGATSTVTCSIPGQLVSSGPGTVMCSIPVTSMSPGIITLDFRYDATTSGAIDDAAVVYMSIVNPGSTNTPTSTIYATSTTATITTTLAATTTFTSFASTTSEVATVMQTDFTTLSGPSRTAYVACSRTLARAACTTDALLHALDAVPMYARRFCREFVGATPATAPAYVGQW